MNQEARKRTDPVFSRERDVAFDRPVTEDVAVLGASKST
jgi:hypothetical protein